MAERIAKRSTRVSRLARLNFALIALFCLIPILTRGQESNEAAQRSVDTAVTAPALDHIISPDDVLDVYIMDVPELSRQYRVSASGNVSFPLLPKPLLAAGQTLGQFSELVARELRDSGYVSDPHVTTSLAQSRVSAVTIAGAVRQPQVYAIFGSTTLLDVISQAGGLGERAGTTAIIHRGDTATRVLALDQRPEGGEKSIDPSISTARTETVNLNRLLQGGDPRLNVVIYPGDRVMIPDGGVVYVIGAVNRPGGFTLGTDKQNLTVLEAVALAQDMKSTAVAKKAMIIRPDKQVPNGRKQIPVDVKQLLAGKSADQVLQPGDILFIPDSSSKRALRRGAEAALQVATGVAIYSGRF